MSAAVDLKNAKLAAKAASENNNRLFVVVGIVTVLVVVSVGVYISRRG